MPMTIRQTMELFTLAALWGGSFVFMRVATPEFGPIALIEMRVVLAALVLLPIWWFREGALAIAHAKSAFGALTLVSVFNSAIPFVLFAYATLFITGGFAAVLNATAPIWSAVVAWVWLAKRMTTSLAIGLLTGLAGVVLLVSDDVSLSWGGASLGILAAMSAAFMYGIAANVTAEKLSDMSPLTLSTLSQVISALVLLPLAIIYWPDQPVSMNAWLCVLVLAVFCTSLAYILYFRLIAQVGSTKAITVTFLVPVFGMLWGALLLDEVVSIKMLIATALILTGTALSTGFFRLGLKE